MNETLILEIIFWSALFMVFYTYLGYGIVLYALVKLKAASPRTLCRWLFVYHDGMSGNFTYHECFPKRTDQEVGSAKSVQGDETESFQRRNAGLGNG